MGYTETGYRVFIGNRVSNVRHVDVIEDGIKCIGTGSSRDDDKSEKEEIENYENISEDENDGSFTKSKFWPKPKR